MLCHYTCPSLHLSFHACQRYICSSCFGNAVLSVFVSPLSLPVRDRTVSPRFQLVHMFHCAFLDNPSTCGNYTSAYAITPLLWLFFNFFTVLCLFLCVSLMKNRHILLNTFISACVFRGDAQKHLRITAFPLSQCVGHV